jgi:hypothetical protein
VLERGTRRCGAKSSQRNRRTQQLADCGEHRRRTRQVELPQLGVGSCHLPEQQCASDLQAAGVRGVDSITECLQRRSQPGE